MNIKKRIYIIIGLILFILLVISLTNKFDNKLQIKEKETILKEKIKVFKNINIYKEENENRYINYYENNKNLTYEEVITNVNIGLDKNTYSYIEKTNLNDNNHILVNKYKYLEKNYIPNDLEKIDKKYFINGNESVSYLKKEAKINFENLSKKSIENNTPVYGQSAYRSYQRQEEIYNNSVKKEGKEKTDLEIARPGFSEHQTGLAIDVSSTKEGNMLSFENTESFNWMENNAYKYGFILRYKKNKEKIHGYIYESWHYRYVGKKIAKDMHNNYSNLTFDEYYTKFLDKKKD